MRILGIGSAKVLKSAARFGNRGLDARGNERCGSCQTHQRRRTDECSTATDADGAQRRARCAQKLRLGHRRLGEYAFSTKELAACITALMRRSGVQKSDFIKACGKRIDLGSHRLIIQGTKSHIDPTECRLMVHLLDLIWGLSSCIEIRTLDVHILRLRKNTLAHWSGRNDPDRAQCGLSLHAGLLVRLGLAKTLTQVRYSLVSFQTAVCA